MTLLTSSRSAKRQEKNALGKYLFLVPKIIYAIEFIRIHQMHDVSISNTSFSLAQNTFVI